MTIETGHEDLQRVPTVVRRTLARHLRHASLLLTGASALGAGLAVGLSDSIGAAPLLMGPLGAALGGGAAAAAIARYGARHLAPVIARPLETIVAHLGGTAEGLPDELHWRRTADLTPAQLDADLKSLDRRLRSVARGTRAMIADLEKARVQASEQNLAKSKFLANMSHELRTPLNAILGYAMLLQEDASDAGNAAAVADLNRIQTAGQNLLARINDILDIAKLEAGRITVQRQIIDLTGFTRSIVDQHCGEDQRNGNAFSVHIAPAVGMMVGDPENIRQCVVNLLSNAFKFTEHGAVELSVEQLSDSVVPAIRFAVKDNGIGIDAEMIEDLFVAFEQADATATRKYGGAGLGLAITRKLARKMGGDCVVESVKGQGSTFSLILPAGESASQAGHRAMGEAVGPMAGPRTGAMAAPPRVIIIDDDLDALELMRRWLGQMGLCALTTSSGKAGLELAREHHPDVILLDALMPDRSGYDLLAELRTDPAISDIPTVLITVDDDQRRGIEAGASDYIRKPLSKEQLRGVVELYCGKVSGEILVIEDDDDAAELIKRSVEEVGFASRRASNGQEGLEMAGALRPSAIVLDLTMPGLDGFDVIDRLRHHGSLHDVPLIVLSSREISLEEHRRLADAGQRFLTKAASTPRQIAQCLKEMVA